MDGLNSKSSPTVFCYSIWKVAMEDDHTAMCCHGHCMVAMVNHQNTIFCHCIGVIVLEIHHPTTCCHGLCYGKWSLHNMLPLPIHGCYGKSSSHCLLSWSILYLVAMENDHPIVCCHDLWMVAMENNHSTIMLSWSVHGCYRKSSSHCLLPLY